MKIKEFEDFVINLFSKEKLEMLEGESGITYKGRDEINKIGYATNLTPEIIEEAQKNNVNMIITHHDAWDFVYGMKDTCLEKLKQYDISHYFVHLPLDDAEFGTGVALLKKLGLKLVEKTHLYKGFHCGRIGEFEKAHDFQSIVTKLEKLLDEPVKAWKNNDRLVKRVGIVTGGGSMTSDVKEAVNKMCDLYITGEKVLYTIQYAKFAGINLIVGSHTFTEIFGVENFTLKIKEKFSDVEIVKLKEDHIE